MIILELDREQTSRYIDKIMIRLVMDCGLDIDASAIVRHHDISMECVQVLFLVEHHHWFCCCGTHGFHQVRIQSHLMSTKYESALRKANLKGFGQ